MIHNPHPLTPKPPAAEHARKPVNPFHVAPPGHRTAHAFAQFRLPDGEHVMAIHTDPNPEIAKMHVERILAQNPEVDFDFEHDFRYCRDAHEIHALHAEWKQKQGDRITAEQMGMDTPMRIITNPEVIPGSESEFKKLQEEGKLPQDAVFEPLPKIERMILTSIRPVGLDVAPAYLHGDQPAPSQQSGRIVPPPGKIVR